VLRCFVAIDLAPAVREAVARAQAELRRLAPRADVRWVDPASLHLTLKFLGEVPPARVDAIAAALAVVAGEHAPLVLRAAGLGAFRSARRARVLWAGITAGITELVRLAAGVDDALAGLGFARESRPFTGHVTLARVRSPRETAPLAGALEAASERELGAWRAAEVVLYRSYLRPSGAVYEALARCPLGGPRI
jgi:2'-5' RNA ligase